MDASVIKKLLALNEMELIAKEATRKALLEYPEPQKEDQGDWTLGRFETEIEGIFEIYVPCEPPSKARDRKSVV